MSSASIKGLSFVIGFIILIFISMQLLNDRVIPPVAEFIASTTQAYNASSTTIQSQPDLTNLKVTASSSLPVSEAVRRLSLLKVIDIKASSSTTSIPGTDVIHSLVADTNESRQQGLSDVKVLPKQSGMLFVFPTQGRYGFWMKDMNFPIDIIWINNDKVVVDISKNVATSTFPTVFTPPSDIVYVLEVNAGYAEKFGIEIGKGLVF